MLYPDFHYPSMSNNSAVSTKSSMRKCESFQDDLEPMAGLSSAAACITLSLPADANCNDGPSTSYYIFSPTFTHQCFDSEHIRGYEPTDAAQKKSVEQATRQRRKMSMIVDPQLLELGHVSFRHHVRAAYQLDLSIRLSPSCRQCAILIFTQPKENRIILPLVEVETSKKKRKRADPHGHSQSVSLKLGSSVSSHTSHSSSCCSSSTASLSSSTSSSLPYSQTGKTRHRRMDTGEIISKLAKAIPMPVYISQDDLGAQSKTVVPMAHPSSASYPFDLLSTSPPKKVIRGKDGNKISKQDIPAEIISLSTNEVVDQEEENILRTIENDYLEDVVGAVLSEYKAPIRTVNGLDCSLFSPLVSFGHTEEQGDFVITLADGKDPKVKEYHDQVQKLSIFFIENADGVNVSSSEGGGSWQILYLFRKHPISVGSSTNNASTPTKATSPAKKESLPCKLSPLQLFLSPARKIIHDTLGILVCGSDQEKSETTKISSPSKQKKQYKYSLVGYMTLFSFLSPFRKPKGGIVLRVCQVVILPPFQRAGHGKKMLQAVYDMAKSSSSSTSQPEIVEINVEDPAPAFVALRDSVDYQLIRDNSTAALVSQDGRGVFKSSKDQLCVSSIIPVKYLDPDCMEPLSSIDATNAAALAKITPRQIQVAYEIFKLETVMKIKDSKNNKADALSEYSNRTNVESKIVEDEEDIEKKWKIMVKKRLNVSHKEIIGACISKEAKKSKLSQLFDETLTRYQAILGFK